METNKSPSADVQESAVEVSMVFRHFHPILAGAAERFRRYSVPLAKHGIRFKVFTLKEDENSPESEQMHETLHVRRLAAEGKPAARDAALFEAAWNELSSKPAQGSVFQTSLAHAESTPWLRRLRRHGVRCVYAGTMVGGQELEGAFWRRWVRQWRYRRYYAPFNQVIASSTVMARWFERLGVRRERLVIIPNGVNVERFCPVRDDGEKRELRRRLGLPVEGKLAIFVGNIVPRKGVHLLLNAWLKVISVVPDAHLVLVGGFDRPTFMTRERMDELGHYQKDIKTMATSPEARDSVIFAGETNRVEDWLRAADLFVFASEQEGMPNAVLEAMACGLPAIITEFQGMPDVEFGQSGREYLLVRRNEEALATGLRNLLGDPKNAQIIGQNAREWTCAQLDVNSTIKRYADVYHACAS
ncbi:MAG: glycosyltransferase family 4 protein [Prosthecobacter sp.]|nr:glycosyltransferase family 4 protein [Prosthecobacter sp.]